MLARGIARKHERTVRKWRFEAGKRSYFTAATVCRCGAFVPHVRLGSHRGCCKMTRTFTAFTGRFVSLSENRLIICAPIARGILAA